MMTIPKIIVTRKSCSPILALLIGNSQFFLLTKTFCINQRRIIEDIPGTERLACTNAFNMLQAHKLIDEELEALDEDLLPNLVPSVPFPNVKW
ncbi:hypothetical protein Plhal304r1_c042g0120871 [Plasmopara halstedii]